MVCPDCGKEAKYYDTVNRRVLMEDRKVVYISVDRYRCTVCKRIHRVSDEIVPFKHYAKSVIEKGRGETDIFPSDVTLWRWKSQNKHSLY